MDDAVLRWALDVAAPGAEVTEVRGLRDGGTPWLVRYAHDGVPGGVVVRLGSVDDPAPLHTEVAALTLLAAQGFPAPRLLAARLGDDPPALLIEQVAGSSTIPAAAPVRRLRALGAAVAALRSISPPTGPALPRRTRPIESVDFDALRRAQEPRPLLVEARARIAERPVPGGDAGDALVHGDLWQGNALWVGDTLAGLIDWDCAGVGPAGIDLGSLRCDAALCFGAAAADEVLRGWEDAAGSAAVDVAYWDVVAALSSPPDMAWFVGAIAGQGRADLTREILVGRRDAFLRAALDRLDAGA